MRVAYNDIEIFTINDESDKAAIYGLSLGFDFCAEHEWGIKELKRNLGIPDCTKETAGVASRLVQKVDKINHGSFKVYARSGSYKLYLSAKKGYKPYTVYYFELVNYWNENQKNIAKERRSKLLFADDLQSGNKEVWTEWDSKEFRIVTTNKDLYDMLVGAMENKSLAVGMGKTTNPFSRAPLAFVDLRFFSEEVLSEIQRLDTEAIDTKEYSDKHVEKFNTLWEKKRGTNPSFREVTYLGGKKFLSPAEIGNLREQRRATKVKMLFWLNTNDSRYKSGWYTFEELLDWIENKGPILRNSQQV